MAGGHNLCFFRRNNGLIGGARGGIRFCGDLRRQFLLRLDHCRNFFGRSRLRILGSGISFAFLCWQWSGTGITFVGMGRVGISGIGVAGIGGIGVACTIGGIYIAGVPRRLIFTALQ